ncbi:MAG: hypothetical protein KAT04_08135 [Methylococcales bacterium]|nr:hypothetical protein [Methylococcales bacterium]
MDKQQNRMVMQYVLDRITDQLNQETRQPDDSYKACMMGLHQLYNLLEKFPLDAEPTTFKKKMLIAMKNHQKTFTTEFIDDYNSAKASIGSVIIAIENHLLG